MSAETIPADVLIDQLRELLDEADAGYAADLAAGPVAGDYPALHDQKIAVPRGWLFDAIDRLADRSTRPSEPVSADTPLPCDVRLPPRTLIRRGVSIRTLMIAIGQRHGWSDAETTFPDRAPTGGGLIAQHDALYDRWLDSALGNTPSEPVSAPAVGGDGALEELADEIVSEARSADSGTEAIDIVVDILRRAVPVPPTPTGGDREVEAVAAEDAADLTAAYMAGFERGKDASKDTIAKLEDALRVAEGLLISAQSCVPSYHGTWHRDWHRLRAALRSGQASTSGGEVGK